ncbi:MAG: CBS domain-containing protein [Hyphomicrobiales bacterium]|nr:CBS domain-containing protein [Hyphomicrobiales bacterium]
MAKSMVRDHIQGQTVVQVDGKESVREAARLMFDRKVGSVLVMDGDNLRGIFTERDALYLFVATRRNSDTTPVEAVMTKDPETIGPDDSAADALARMDKGGYRHLPVVEGGKVLGVISRRELNG